MRVMIHPRTVSADEALRVRIDERLASTLGPVRPYVGGIDVFLTDVNGPRGGPDKNCRVVAYLPAVRPVVVSRTDRDPVAAVARAAAVCRRSVRNLVARRRTRRVRPAAAAGPRARVAAVR